MKLFSWMIALVVLLAAACQTGLPSAKEMVTQSDSISYAIGNALANSYVPAGINLNPEEIGKGYQDFVDGAASIDEDWAMGYLRGMQMEVMAKQAQGGDTPLSTNLDSASYALGFMQASQLKGQFGFDMNASLIAQGCSDVMGGDPEAPKLDDTELQAVLAKFDAQIQEKMTALRAEEGKKNREEGESFLAANKTKEGVKATDSGLQYKVLKSGSGATPKSTDVVRVHYEGRLLNGEVFDTSRKGPGEPIEFRLNGVIRGWTEGLQLMKVGETFQFYIPDTLAYGPMGSGPQIGPNATLIFDVELLDIVKNPEGN